MSEEMKNEMTSQEKSELKEWLRPVIDPELNMSLVDLGLVYSVENQEGKAQVEMTLTSPGCPAGDYLMSAVRDRMNEHEAVQETEVRIVWDPPWNPAEMASDEAKEVLGLW